jgi:hypothetical protein
MATLVGMPPFGVFTRQGVNLDPFLTFPDFGGLIPALRKLFADTASWDWTNRVCFLRSCT